MGANLIFLLDTIRLYGVNMALYHKEIYWNHEYDEQVADILRNFKSITPSEHLKRYLETSMAWRRNYDM